MSILSHILVYYDQLRRYEDITKKHSENVIYLLIFSFKTNTKLEDCTSSYYYFQVIKKFKRMKVFYLIILSIDREFEV